PDPNRTGVAAERKKLIAKRDRLLYDLVRLERERRSGRTGDDRYAARHEQLIAALEPIYGALDGDAPGEGERTGLTVGAPAIGPAVRRRIGLLAHELHLYPELSARQNLAFFARLYGEDRAAVVDSALEQAQLAERADDPVSSFSRGMRQRLALERALLHEPRLV